MSRFVLISTILLLTAQPASADCFLGLPFLCSMPSHHYRQRHKAKVTRKVIIQKKTIIEKKTIVVQPEAPLVW